MANERLPYVLDFQNGEEVEAILKKAQQLPTKNELDLALASKADLDEDGLIPSSEVPPMALEHMKTVQTTADMYNLTIEDVQNGDTVYVNDTKVMYLVIDDTKLDQAAGYKEYSAGTAARALADEDGVNFKQYYLKKADAFTPTTAQANAMDSGIDSTKVEQIETNKNNILSLQSDIYFEENKSKLAGNIETRYDADSMTRNWALAATTAIMHGVPISNAIKLKTVKYNVGNTNLYQAHQIGLATISGNTATITHLKRNADYFQGVVTVDVNFELNPTKDYYLFLICESGIVQWQIDNTGTKYYTFANPSTPTVGTTVAITTNSGNSVAVAQLDIIYETDGYFVTTLKRQRGVITVAKSGGDYSTLAEAIAAANDSAANPVTIQLYPGVYNEHITLLNRYISIIGVNRDTCIIRDDSGRYNNDPIKISGGKWRLENLSLISTHSNAGSWTPSWVFPDLPSYALHLDNGNAGGTGVVQNCYVYSENLNAIGAGTHNGEKIQIINCEIVRNTTDANYVSSDYKGAVACHSPNIYDDSETASEFSMYNCNITCNLDEALQLKALANTCKMKCAMVGNTLVANDSVSNVVTFTGSFTTKNNYIKIQSHGNSTSELNAIE